MSSSIKITRLSTGVTERKRERDRDMREVDQRDKIMPVFRLRGISPITVQTKRGRVSALKIDTGCDN